MIRCQPAVAQRTASRSRYGYNHRHPPNQTIAVAMLRQLKGRLRDVTGVTVEAVTHTAASSEAYWQLLKASGVHVYQQDGGWHADLMFRDLPHSVPTIIGTPAGFLLVKTILLARSNSVLALS